MSAACYCDFDPATIYKRSRPIARKIHDCSECPRKINIGERYEYVFGVWDGDASSFKTCISCIELRDLVEFRAECFCWNHGSMIDDAIETVREVAYGVPGLGMAFGRLLIKRRRERVACDG